MRKAPIVVWCFNTLRTHGDELAIRPFAPARAHCHHLRLVNLSFWGRNEKVSHVHGGHDATTFVGKGVEALDCRARFGTYLGHRGLG